MLRRFVADALAVEDVAPTEAADAAGRAVGPAGRPGVVAG